MPDSRQLDILKRITDHLQGITPTNGYDFDLSNSVFRGRHTYGDDAPIPMVSIVEHLTADVVVDTAGDNKIERSETWVLLVQGWLDHTTENPTDEAYQLKASVEKRMSECIKIDPNTGDPVFPTIYLLGRTVTQLTIGPGVVSVAVRPEGGSAKSFFYLPIGVGLAMDVSDPFLPDVVP